MNKKTGILVGIILYFVSAFFSYFFFASASGKVAFKTPTIKYAPPKNGEKETAISADLPRSEECPLNGELLTKAHKKIWESRRPLGVMIENSLDARPQSGLTSADVIYEAVAEGGITRMLAMFYCKDSDGYIGPVRSARIYFMSFLQEYGDSPLYAHVGGANTPGPADALGEIRDLGWDSQNDLNQFGIPFPYYWRDYDRLPDRATEHTMYSTTKKLWEYAKNKRNLTDKNKKGDKWDENFTKWKFKDDASKKGDLTKISFKFWDSRPDYDVTWQYDKASNSFKRFNGGNPHTDKNNGKQIAVKNVAIAFMDESPANDGYPGGHMLYATTGSGDGIVFQDGKAITGTWKKKDHTSKLRFFDKSGVEISFNRGLTWIEIVPQGNKVNY